MCQTPNIVQVTWLNNLCREIGPWNSQNLRPRLSCYKEITGEKHGLNLVSLLYYWIRVRSCSFFNFFLIFSCSIRHYMGEDLDPLSLKDLQNLEQQLDTALKHIRSRKVNSDRRFSSHNSLLFIQSF